LRRDERRCYQEKREEKADPSLRLPA